MIHIEQHQEVPGFANWRVYDPTGDYQDNDLIQCYDVADPGLALGSLQAQFIVYGGIVYQFNSPTELAAQLVEIDPGTTHEAVKLQAEMNSLSARMERGEVEVVDPIIEPTNQLPEEVPTDTPPVGDPVAPPEDVPAPDPTPEPIIPEPDPVPEPEPIKVEPPVDKIVPEPTPEPIEVIPPRETIELAPKVLPDEEIK